jgi:hypothetical protein
MEEVLACVDHKIQSLHTELTGKIEKTQIELQTVELSLDGHNKKLREEVTALKSDLSVCLGAPSDLCVSFLVLSGPCNRLAPEACLLLTQEEALVTMDSAVDFVSLETGSLVMTKYITILRKHTFFPFVVDVFRGNSFSVILSGAHGPIDN